MQLKGILRNKLFGNLIIFTLSTILNKGLNFFVLPILTYYLTKEDYGYLGFVMSVVTISSIYVGLWPGNFLIAKFSAFGKEKMAAYLSNILIILILTFLAVLGLLYLFEAQLFASFSDRDELILSIGFYTLFMVCFNILNTITQLEKNAKKFALMQFIFSFGSLGIALVLIILLHYGWKGKFYAEMGLYAIFAAYMLYYLIREEYVRFSPSAAKLKELFAYLFPMTFHVVGIFLMVTIDKVILARYLPLESVGIYTISMTMAVIVNIVFDAMLRAWEPYIFEKLSGGSREDMQWVVRTTLLYSLFAIVFAIIYIVAIPWVFPIMVDEKFSDALHYIPWLVAAFTLEGLRKPIATLLMHKNRVKTLGGISFSAAILNIALNIMLIRHYGIMGAIYATLIAFCYLYLMTLLFARSAAVSEKRVRADGKGESS